MTDQPAPQSTQFATPSQNPVASPAPAAPEPAVDDANRKAETTEEEPYTIKCICNFSDDDGNTIYLSLIHI